MSNRNKLENKSLRRSQRAARPTPDRTPVSPIAQKTSARILSDPKKKLTGNTRRRLQRSRGFSIDRPLPVVRPLLPEVVFALKLESLTMVKLVRRLKQSARRAATCRYLLAKIHPGSKFIASLNAEQTHQLSLCRQVAAEISVRNHNTQH